MPSPTGSGGVTFDEANDGSQSPTISADGHYVVFTSAATNLVPGGTRAGALLRDLTAGTTTGVVFSVKGEPELGGTAGAKRPISADGRYIAFASGATNLVPGGTNGKAHVFVRDTVAGINLLVSVSSSGEQGNDDSFSPSISSDRRYVVFTSTATNLVPGDTNGVGDVFIRDRVAGVTERVSVTSGEEQGIYMSNQSHDQFDWRWVSDYGTVSDNGRYVVFHSMAAFVTSDLNLVMDIYLRDRVAGTTTLVSASSDGITAGNSFSALPVISDGGRYIAFASSATNLVPGDTNGSGDIFVRDLMAGTTTKVSMSSTGEQSDKGSNFPDISPDGRYVAFSSSATNLVSGDDDSTNDIFVRDTHTGTTTRVSLSSDGGEPNNECMAPSISADGRYVAFQSYATNLVPGDTNGVWDIFVRDRVKGTTERVSVSSYRKT